MDLNNPVIKLCAEGMQAEFAGRPDEAKNAFTRAWASSRDDFEACIAAHYLARHQPTPEETLHWNQEALKHANLAPEEMVRDFYPSLYLNLAWSHEMLGALSEARKYYDLAAESAVVLPTGSYAALVQGGVKAGQGRTSANIE